VTGCQTTLAQCEQPAVTRLSWGSRTVCYCAEHAPGEAAAEFLTRRGVQVLALEPDEKDPEP